MRTPFSVLKTVGRPSNVSLNWACHAKAKVGVLDLQNLRRDMFGNFEGRYECMGYMGYMCTYIWAYIYMIIYVFDHLKNISAYKYQLY